MKTSEVEEFISNLETEILEMKTELAEKETVLRCLRWQKNFPNAILSLLASRPGKLFKPAMIIERLRRAGFGKFGSATVKDLREACVTANTLLRRFEKDGKIGRFIVTWDQTSGKAGFAYFSEALAK